MRISLLFVHECVCVCVCVLTGFRKSILYELKVELTHECNLGFFANVLVKLCVKT